MLIERLEHSPFFTIFFISRKHFGLDGFGTKSLLIFWNQLYNIIFDIDLFNMTNDGILFSSITISCNHFCWKVCFCLYSLIFKLLFLKKWSDCCKTNLVEFEIINRKKPAIFTRDCNFFMFCRKIFVFYISKISHIKCLMSSTVLPLFIDLK